jgi:hypothetical protein
MYGGLFWSAVVTATVGEKIDWSVPRTLWKTECVVLAASDEMCPWELARGWTLLERL